jgi:hypothetical protein
VTQRTINARQREVLSWIGDGCPTGVMTNETHKATAAALQSRRLVTIRKKPWRAQITDAGTYFLQHGRYPDGHWPEATPARGWTTRPKDLPTTALRPVDQMLADLAESDGRLERAGDRSYWENLVASATRHGKVAAGKVLTVQGTWDHVVLVLADKPAWMQADEPEVDVPDQLRRPHPVVAALRDDARALPFSKPTRQRALRLLQAIAAAATSRGHTVRAPQPRSGYGRATGQVEIVVGSHPYTITVSEATTQVDHQLTADELRHQQRYGSRWAPRYDHLPNGRLRIAINGGWKVQTDRVEDTKTRSVDGKLGALLLELELRAQEADERCAAEAQAVETRRVRWKEVHAQAKIAAIEVHRARVLLERSHAYQKTLQVAAYLAAAEKRSATLVGVERIAADEWLAWARQHVADSDPLAAEHLTMPSDPNITAEMLNPFMQGLSPYGPA